MLELFLLGFALAASPGPDFFLILRHTLVHGRLTGYATLAGNRVSLCLHLLFAVVGLSAVLRASPEIFAGIRALGAAYLIYLGAKNIIGRRPAREQDGLPAEAGPLPPIHAFRQGFLTNLLNPKVSLFFFSLFPQVATTTSLDRSPGALALSFFIGNSLWWVPLVAVAGLAGVRSVVPRFQRVVDVAFGLLFVGLGLRLVADLLL